MYEDFDFDMNENSLLEGMRGKTILVVDDSQTIRMHVKDLLEDIGMRVLMAEDGGTCLSILESERPDIIILDIIMPQVNGIEVCRIIKADDRDIPGDGQPDFPYDLHRRQSQVKATGDDRRWPFGVLHTFSK